MYTEHVWKSDRHFNFRYYRYLPEGYDGNKKYPLVLYLHGAGERGDDITRVAWHGFLRYVRENNSHYPFIIVAPQCPFDRYWGCYTESLLAFLDHISEELSVDATRVYVTGLSMGGTGTFMLAMADPDRFAAIAPVCGSGICWYGEALKDIPVMMYHGDLDDIVPIDESITMLRAINAHGGNARLKILNGVEHDAWNYAYAGSELADWLLSHKR